MGTLNVFVTSSNKMIILSNYVYSTFFTCTTDSLSFSFYNKEMTEYDTLVYEMHSLLCFWHIINVTNTMFYFTSDSSLCAIIPENLKTLFISVVSLFSWTYLCDC